MEIIMEILLELILEGSVEVLTGGSSEKTKGKTGFLILRILAALILLLVYGGLIGLCGYLAVVSKSWIAGLIGCLILLITVAAGISLYRKVKNRKKSQ